MSLGRIYRQKWLEDITKALARVGFVGNTFDLSKGSGVISASSIPAHATTHKSGGSDTVSPFGGEFSATDLVATGLTGATAAGRWVGNTTSGAPVAGAFLKGDWITTQDGHIFICTTAGSPGTWADAGSAGTVTSVGLTMPSDFTVGGSPVTSSGTLAVTANSQSSNTVKAGPISGGAAAPTYRALVPADLPVATSAAFGAVKPDNSTITISAGVISAVGGGGSGNKITRCAYGSEPGSPSIGDMVIYTDGFTVATWDGSVWQPEGPIFPVTKPPAVSNWTWVNQGTATAVDYKGGIYLSAPAAATNLRFLVKTAPTTPYTITALFATPTPNISSNSCYLFFRNSSSGAVVVFGPSGASWPTLVQRFNSPTSFNATVVNLGATLANSIFLRIADDGTNRTFSTSVDGRTFQTFFSELRTAFITPDQVGWGVLTNNLTYGQDMLLQSWVAA